MALGAVSEHLCRLGVLKKTRGAVKSAGRGEKEQYHYTLIGDFLLTGRLLV